MGKDLVVTVNPYWVVSRSRSKKRSCSDSFSLLCRGTWGGSLVRPFLWLQLLEFHVQYQIVRCHRKRGASEVQGGYRGRRRGGYSVSPHLVSSIFSSREVNSFPDSLSFPNTM